MYDTLTEPQLMTSHKDFSLNCPQSTLPHPPSMIRIVKGEIQRVDLREAYKKKNCFPVFVLSFGIDLPN